MLGGGEKIEPKRLSEKWAQVTPKGFFPWGKEVLRTAVE
jgi:hypothetical protein